MNTQDETLKKRELITISLRPEQQDFLTTLLDDFSYLPLAKNLSKQISFLQSGDACRHPVQSPEVLGQGGTLSVDDLRQTLKNPDQRSKHLRPEALGLGW